MNPTWWSRRPIDAGWKSVGGMRFGWSREGESNGHRQDRQRSRWGIPCQRFEATCPTADDFVSESGRYHDFYRRLRPTIRKISASTIGFYLDHYFVHVRARDEGWGNYVLLEDDCRLHRGWQRRPQRLFRRERIPADWDPRRLGSRAELLAEFPSGPSDRQQLEGRVEVPRRRASGGSHFKHGRLALHPGEWRLGGAAGRPHGPGVRLQPRRCALHPSVERLPREGRPGASANRPERQADQGSRHSEPRGCSSRWRCFFRRVETGSVIL